jgi:hypothetical protein
MGRGADLKPTFTCNGFVAVHDFVSPPTSVGFAAHAADGLRAAKRPCSPKTSLIAHAKNGYTRGRVYTVKGQGVLLTSLTQDGLNELARERERAYGF